MNSNNEVFLLSNLNSMEEKHLNVFFCAFFFIGKEVWILECLIGI